MALFKPVDKGRAPGPPAQPWGLRDLVSPAYPDAHPGPYQPRRGLSTVSTAPTSTTERKIYSIETNPVENNPSRVETRGYEIGGTK